MIIFKVTADYNAWKDMVLYEGLSMEKAFEIFGKAIESKNYNAVRINRITTLELDSWS